MVDNRAFGPIGLSSSINFKSGDISGTAAKTSDDRASQGTEYFMQEGEEPNTQNESFIDRSIQLKASLASLALLNVVSVLQNKKRNILFDDEDYAEKISTNKVKKIDEHSKNSEFNEKN